MHINKKLDYRNTKFLHLFTVKGMINDHAVEGFYDLIGDFKVALNRKKAYSVYPVILKDVKEPGTESAYVYYDEKLNEDLVKQALFEHAFRKYGSLTFLGINNETQ